MSVPASAISDTAILPVEVLMKVISHVVPQNGAIISTNPRQRAEYEFLWSLMTVHSAFAIEVKKVLYSRPINFILDSDDLRNISDKTEAYQRYVSLRNILVCMVRSYRWKKAAVHIVPKLQFLDGVNYSEGPVWAISDNSGPPIPISDDQFMISLSALSRKAEKLGIWLKYAMDQPYSDETPSTEIKLIFHDAVHSGSDGAAALSCWSSGFVASIINSWKWIGTIPRGTTQPIGEMKNFIVLPSIGFACNYKGLSRLFASETRLRPETIIRRHIFRSLAQPWLQHTTVQHRLPDEYWLWLQSACLEESVWYGRQLIMFQVDGQELLTVDEDDWCDLKGVFSPAEVGEDMRAEDGSKLWWQI